MKRLLITGGTVFVSRYAAEYFSARGYDVYVLNRNTRPQPENVTLIEADRRAIGDKLSGLRFDAVIDVTAYNAGDVSALVPCLPSFGKYILISSSAVYPETSAMPIKEDSPLGANRCWDSYGTDKIAAERVLLDLVPDAYILRPPYLYGPMNNVYREAFVFECADSGRPFYIPREGEMLLQFYYIGDLCRFIELIIEQAPSERIFNVGNRDAISVRDWVTLCYECAGKRPEFVSVGGDIEQRAYFSFYDYEYILDVERQYALMNDVTDLRTGLEKSYRWYGSNMDKINRKPFIEYIDSHIATGSSKSDFT